MVPVPRHAAAPGGMGEPGFHFRRGGGGRELGEQYAACPGAQVRIAFAINDRLDIALAVDADGLHVGQSDMPVAEARRLLGPDKIRRPVDHRARAGRARRTRRRRTISASARSIKQQTKDDASPPLGIDGLRAIRGLTQKPIVAIGGLTPDNSALVIAAGADGLAVVSAIVAADDPEAAARRFARLFGGPVGLRSDAARRVGPPPSRTRR